MKSWEITINQLAGETSVMPALLIEDTILVKMIKDGKPYEQLLEYVNGNF